MTRPYCLYAADEVLTAEQNYLMAPEHVLGYVDAKQKLGIYSHWQEDNAAPLVQGQELEYYDYGTEAGRQELENRAATVVAKNLAQTMLGQYLPNEIQAPLPACYQSAQQAALQAYWKYVNLASLTTTNAALTL